jgi:4-carboxymuconolactone decarboxylase
MTTQPAPREWASVLPKLAELTDSFLFGEIWERPELSKRDRSLITVAVLTALYRPDQLRNHLNRALDNGVTREELAEVITHVTFYAGWPTGANAGPILKDVLDRRPA